MTEILPENIRNLKVLPTREDLLARLPAGGIVAELGVDEGGFSRKILDIAKPRGDALWKDFYRAAGDLL